jgi:hypothetical protein
MTGSFFSGAGRRMPEDGPRAVEGLFVEELDAAEGDGHRVARVMFDILDEEEVLAQLFLGHQVG